MVCSKTVRPAQLAPPPPQARPPVAGALNGDFVARTQHAARALQSGDKLDVVMAPKVEGPWDIHFLDQYLALLEARHNVRKPILIHAIIDGYLQTGFESRRRVYYDLQGFDARSPYLYVCLVGVNLVILLPLALCRHLLLP